ncbi:hypothetical protein OVS_02280 [Mycoplasma ovis str. Michigan]|uniref:Uncharacterized protein n=1 Tax=Mycoplasma ovis str. Michigan TaxID=1415773 RepID=A0ABM5P0K6_9MOLU|nr:hypothetical protein [Mycoplasma ovis]AHC39948.1 hypothetical protein OVS_02280 [Mycoplasma ovis str. Michigan]
MLWKKLLLEIVATSGFGGGIGGWFGINNQGVSIDSEEDISYLKVEEETLRLQKEARNNLSDGWGKISELDRTILGSWRWQSEGVGEDLIFISGWDGDGRHKKISSDNHSQADKDLWGGRKISIGHGWFGPRQVSRSIADMEKVDQEKFKSYWPIIQQSGQYLSQSDLDGIQKYWKNRSIDLEEDIFGLYHGRKWWADKFGLKKGQDRVDLEFDFSKLKQMLSKTEQELRDKKWTFGQIFQNPKLAQVRLLGDVEATAFNYLKHVAWPEAEEVKKLKEKKIAIAVMALMLGEEIGFDCETGKKEHKDKYFKECSSNTSDVKVKRVLKSTWKYSYKYWSPTKDKQGQWHKQEKIEDKDARELVKMDDIKNTAFLDEKCEDPAGFWDYFSDSAKEIRREICDQIIRPWFGDIVTDKRLCLIELEDFNYHFRLNTYLQVLEIPLWNKRNTFWTKCSNYGI